MTLGVAVGQLAAPPAGAAPRSAYQDANRFLQVAYTYHDAWYGQPTTHLNLREHPYASSVLDHDLTDVVIAPEMDADINNYVSEGNGKVLHSTAKPGGVIAFTVKMPFDIVSTDGIYPTHFTAKVSVKVIKGVWRAIGTYLPVAQGPNRFCDDVYAPTAYCSIYPARKG